MDPIRETTNGLPFPSQANSHFPIEPLPASSLLDQEVARKAHLARKGNLTTGCKDLDEYVLLGGFERGSVVGVSAEEEEVGVAIALQIVAHLLATDMEAKAMIITTLPATVLLPKLRKALVGRLSAAEDGLRDLQGRAKVCLERISIARVFDVEGLWEVLQELEDAVYEAGGWSPQVAEGEEADQKFGNPAERQEETARGRQRIEVMDSEDEGGLSSPEPPPNEAPWPRPTPAQDKIPPVNRPPPSTVPDIILLTHTSTLLNALFTGRDKDAAHNTMLLLSSRLRALARSPSHGGPLIMLLNSTTSPHPSLHHSDEHISRGRDGDVPTKPAEPTLRSIFSPPPAPFTIAGQQQPGQNSTFASARRNKPSFGLVFSQMLDLHLLCTRVPRTRADAARALATSEMVLPDVSCVWAVEVLLDEMGVYERRDDGRHDWSQRRNREQRWAAVDVDGEGRVVSAFAS
ncbi:hypothetical protein VTI74DRAFT_4287 [Chaetomium olivicolor]